MEHSVGFIGLGKMGQNIVLHLLERGLHVVVFNRTTTVSETFAQQASEGTYPGKLAVAPTIETFASMLAAPRTIIMMVSAGKAVDDVIEQLLAAGITKDDVLIDAGNSFFKDSVRRHEALAPKGVTYIDSGTSGGLEGARLGACLMLGGDKEAVARLSWLWDAMAVADGWTYMGPSGAGHFVKMVHNGVEYGMDQAIGEGFDLLANGPYQLDLARVATNWTRGSVVRSWLVELATRAFGKEPRLESYSGRVGGGETGRWTLQTAEEHGVAMEVLEEALEAREDSLTKPTFGSKVVAALRNEYGGHKEPVKGSK